jgi:hypothetical protein
MSASDLVAQLAAVGTPPELLAAVAKELFTAEVNLVALETRRSNERARKAEQRHGKSREVTGQAVKSRDRVSPNEDNLTPSATPSVISDEITPPSENPVLKPEHVVEAWNEMAARTGLPTVRKLTPDRVKALGRRIKENTIQDFTEAIDAIERSPFLRGDSKRGWRADFDFLLSPTKFNRLLEGTYGE